VILADFKENYTVGNKNIASESQAISLRQLSFLLTIGYIVHGVVELNIPSYMHYDYCIVWLSYSCDYS